MTRKEEIEDRIHFLANTLGGALREMVFAPNLQMETRAFKKALGIADEIESYGYYVEMDFLDGSAVVSRPTENLSLEDAEKYDKWFLRRAGIKQTGDP